MVTATTGCGDGPKEPKVGGDTKLPDLKPLPTPGTGGPGDGKTPNLTPLPAPGVGGQPKVKVPPTGNVKAE